MTPQDLRTHNQQPEENPMTIRYTPLVAVLIAVCLTASGTIAVTAEPGVISGVIAALGGVVAAAHLLFAAQLRRTGRSVVVWPPRSRTKP